MGYCEPHHDEGVPGRRWRWHARRRYARWWYARWWRRRWPNCRRGRLRKPTLSTRTYGRRHDVNVVESNMRTGRLSERAYSWPAFVQARIMNKNSAWMLHKK